MLTASSLGVACSEPGGGRLTVMAASSLTEVMAELTTAYEAGHPGVSIELQLAGSQALRLQLEHGAVADVFASASLEHLVRLVEQGRIRTVRAFAENELAVVVPEGSRARDALSALGEAERLVVGGPEVPVGRYTRILLENIEAERGQALAERIRAAVVSEEANVRLVRAKVELGEADAAVVYESDARGRRLRRLSLPEGLGPRARYGVGVVDGSEAGARFVDWLLEPERAGMMERHGFRTVE